MSKQENDEKNAYVYIAGYASLFGLRDLKGEQIKQGAFSGSLTGERRHYIRMLYQHDTQEPVGLWTSIFEDQTGLYVRGKILTKTSKARTIAELARVGAVDGLSIGYKTVKEQKRQYGRTLTQIDLWEISIVTFPLLPQARFSVLCSPSGTSF